MSESNVARTIIDRLLDGSAPEHLRAAAARGALPLSRSDLVRAQVHLLGDTLEAVRRDAQAQLAAVNDGDLEAVLSEDDCAPEVLAHYAERAVRTERLAELVVFHKSVPDAALTLMAAQGTAAVIDLVLTNQQRLLASPGLLDRLASNPSLRTDQRGRILDLLDRFISRQAAEAGPVEATGEADAAEAPVDVEEAARLLDVEVGELFTSSEILGGEEFEAAEDPAVRSTYRKILTLNTAQKALLAMRGGREERQILIRDTNKLVALSVLRNPRLNDQEIEAMSRLRNVSDEVLRAIGTNRDWIKNYSVMRELVRNPKTPPGISTNFVTRLNQHDLKMLARDKNVPELIRRMGKKALVTREQRKKPAFSKGRR